jgi:hypothetical protein
MKTLLGLISRWIIFAILASTTATLQEAHAQTAPPPPIVPPTDQVVNGLLLRENESVAVGFQGSQNRFFVVFEDLVTGFINVILIGTDGSTIGTPRIISDEPGHCPIVEKSVADPPVVAWVNQRDRDLRMRILNSDGSPNGPEVVVDTAHDPEFSPGCPSLSRFVHDGVHYLLTWTDATGSLRGRILDISNPSNPFAGNAFEIARGFAGPCAAAFDYTNSHFLVVYTQGLSGIFGQLVKVNGTLAGTAFQIATPPTADSVVDRPAVAFSPEATEGRFLVVWEQRHLLGSPFLFRAQIVGQRVNLTVDPMGVPMSSLTDGTIAVDEPTTGFAEQKEPDITYSLALGQYMVTWHSLSSTEVRGRLINLDGTMPRRPFTVSVSPTSDTLGFPRVAWSETFTPINDTLAPNRMQYIVLWRGIQQDMRFRFVDPHLDSDGDGLLDDWETGGADLNNDGRIDNSNDINLLAFEPNNPPSPQRKDVYLEIDWMDCTVGGCAPGDTHNHRLRDLNGNGVPDIVEQMVAAFARNHAPSNVRNPDGSNGITLHVDYGQLGGGNAIADLRDNPSTRDFEVVPANVKAANLDGRRRRIFHYGVSTHECCGGADLPGQFFWAGRGGTERNLNDVIAIASNTFMHELGHNLGLFHGGGDFINFKPNHLSVMNYVFSAGIPVVGGQTPLLDFSNRRLQLLNEAVLNERVGLGLTSGNQATIFSCPNGIRSTQPAAGPINWNCNQRKDGTPIIDMNNVMVDLNGDRALGELLPSDDWSNLFYNFRVIGNFSSAAFVPPTPDNPNSVPPPEDLPSPEEIHQSLARPIIQISMKTVPHKTKPGHRVKFVVEVQNTGLGLAQNVKLVTELDEQHLGMFSLGALLPGDSQKRKGSFIVPEDCVPMRTFVATVDLEDALNGQLPSVMHSQEIPVICHDDDPAIVD